MSLTTKILSAAVTLAVATSASAERVIVNHNSNAKGLKKGHQVLREGNGWFAVELDEQGKKKMRARRGFRSMEADAKRFPLAIWNDDVGDPTVQQITPYAIYQSQGNQLALQAGQKVCVIDSGLDRSSRDFNFRAITGDNDPGTGNWYEHGGPHGTHVSGTVAALDNGIGVVGMAPGVPLHIIKVFNADGWGYSSDLAFAAGKCTDAGANIITMSLGGGAPNATEQGAFDTFSSNGGLVLAAAGNDGNNTRSYPAGYKSVMMIGANDANNNIADFSQHPSNTVTSGHGSNTWTETNDGFGVEVTAGGVNTLSTFPQGLGSFSSLTANGIGYPSLGMENKGTVEGYLHFMGTAEAPDAGADGNICLIDRGNISFHDKVLNCENSGGEGAIIINNVPGVLAGTLGDSNVTTIPVVGAALEDRTELLAAMAAEILVNDSDYSFLSGTSMATPAAAGAAALIWSNHPTCSGFEIRAAMKAAADDQGAAGRDDFFGYGIVKAKDASDYLSINGCSGVTEEFALSGFRTRGGHDANLVWSGATGANVDVYIDGTLLDSTANDGEQTYAVDKKQTFTFQVCESGSLTTCSNAFTL